MSKCLIISSLGDTSTYYVMDWMLSRGYGFVKIDENSKIFIDYFSLNIENSYDISIKSINYYTKEATRINLDNIKSIWYRRGDLKFNRWNSKLIEDERYFLNDWNRIKKIIYTNIKFQLGDYYFENQVNKLEMIVLAQRAGFMVPASFVSDNVNYVLEKLEHYNTLIIKPIHGKTIDVLKRNLEFTSGIQIIKKHNIINVKKIAFPLFFQEYIEKQYELRVVVIKDEIFAMCIFSQISESSKYDFREDYSGCRFVPFKLNKIQVIKIKKFMSIINQDSGSLDLIVDKKGDLYFLEINPTGQFDFVSKYCNYNIELHIAQILSNE